MYPGTCFHLDQRLRKGGQLRPVVTERSYVAAGGGWIWNAVADRFGMAIQRLDLYHANTCRWAVANHVPSTDPQAARQWVKPLLRQLRSDQVARVITRLSVLTPTLTAAAATAGDEALLALEICWRNDRWEHRFPHVVRPSATPNGTPRPPSFSATPFPRPALAAHPNPEKRGLHPEHHHASRSCRRADARDRRAGGPPASPPRALGGFGSRRAARSVCREQRRPTTSGIAPITARHPAAVDEASRD